MLSLTEEPGAASRNRSVRNAPNLSTLQPDALLDRHDLVALSGFRHQTFRMWAMHGRGPKVTKSATGRSLYRVADVREWMAERSEK